MSELVVPIASTEASFGAIARKLRIGGRAVGNHLTINLTRVTSEQGSPKYGLAVIYSGCVIRMQQNRM
jgi:hypothetical protein